MAINNNKGFLKKRLNAFGHAFSGLWQGLVHETHLKIHLLATVCVIFAGFYFSVSKTEWLALCLCIGAVISLELMNSAVERTCNKLMPEQNKEVKYIKDVAAAAVLVSAIVSVIVALIIFGPHLVSS